MQRRLITWFLLLSSLMIGTVVTTAVSGCQETQGRQSSGEASH